MIGVALVVLWALSLLGGQASLRIITVGSKANGNTTVEYLNMFLSKNDIFTFESKESWSKANALFVASLLSDAAVKNSSVDSWGNVKIPMIESLRSVADSEGWHGLDCDTGVAEYSSLIGIPIAGLPTVGNLTSVIETSYWTLDCPLLTQRQDGFETTNPDNYTWQGFFINSSPHGDIWKEDIVNTNTRPRKLNYSGTFIDKKGAKQFDYAKCDIKTSYVEVHVQCSPTSCEPTKLRTSRSPSELSVGSHLASFNNLALDTPF